MSDDAYTQALEQALTAARHAFADVSALLEPLRAENARLRAELAAVQLPQVEVNGGVPSLDALERSMQQEIERTIQPVEDDWRGAPGADAP